jgi:hypothetical protein
VKAVGFQDLGCGGLSKITLVRRRHCLGARVRARCQWRLLLGRDGHSIAIELSLSNMDGDISGSNQEGEARCGGRRQGWWRQ